MINWDRLAELPFKKIVITYSGSNDEGYIDEMRPEPAVEGMGINYEFERELEQIGYDVLESSYPGWEINEGAHGHMTIDVAERSISLHHGEIVESTNWYDSVIQ